MLLADYIHELAARFEEADLSYSHGTDNAWDEAVFLCYGTLGIPFHQSLEEVDRELKQVEMERLAELGERRLVECVPVAYLVGRTLFAGHEFLVDARALVPRSPVAELIGNDFSPLLKSPPATVLDLCCGGGCIGIAIALQFPEAKVVLADLSEEALDLARRNVALHNLEDRVQIVQSDLFDGIEGCFDLIVSNPPYVGRLEYEQLPREFFHEPSLGLLSDEDGLAIPVAILARATAFLRQNGLLILEVGFSDEALQFRFPDFPFLWLDFEQGGAGVLAADRSLLSQFEGN